MKDHNDIGNWDLDIINDELLKEILIVILLKIHLELAFPILRSIDFSRG